MCAQVEDADRKIGRTAGRQQGMVKTEQALDAGLSRQSIQTRIKKGIFWPQHRGVYAVGHPAKTTKAEYMGAVLACGDGSRICGLAAAHLLALTAGPPPPPEVATRRRKEVPGIVSHQTRFVGPRHETTVDDVPTSRPAVALVESASRLDDVALARAIHAMTVKRVTEASIRAALADRPNYPDRDRLEQMLFGGGPLLLSELENRFLGLVRDAGLPLPATNSRVDHRLVDCRWSAHRLTVELLGYRFHNSRQSWERDHARRREAHARGDRFRSYTREDIEVESAATIEDLRNLLGSIRAE